MRQDARAHALVGAETERAANALGQPVEVVIGQLDPADQRLRVAAQHLPRVGQVRGLRAARTFDQLLADEPLERRHLMADCDWV